MTLFRYVARQTLVAFLAALGGVVALFVVIDFAENASVLTGPGWLLGVLELYANKVAAVSYQLAPAAMLLASAITASGFRASREYTAMRSLGFGPWRLAVPVLSVAALVGVVMTVFDDYLAVDASVRVEQIMAERFHRSGRWERWHERKSWYRSHDGRRVYQLRAQGPGGSFEGVTVLEFSQGFVPTRRIEASRMIPEPDGQWVLEGVRERVFDQRGQTSYIEADRKEYRFEEDSRTFSIRPGRPAGMRRGVLREQTRLRRGLGLPVVDFELEWHKKFAYPLAGIPAGLLALALALRRERRGHITTALMEAVGVTLLFWVSLGVTSSLGMAGRLAPMLAAWAPNMLFLVAGTFLVRRNA